MNEQKQYLREAGEHAVKIILTNKRPSKAGNMMLVVTFSDEMGREINGYFVASAKPAMEALAKLKEACGLPQSAKGAELVGKALRILVGFQDPNKTGGKLYTNIEDYFPPLDNAYAPDRADANEDLPF